MAHREAPHPDDLPEREPGDGPHRVESDSLGEVRVHHKAKWGAQTQRAVDNFRISGEAVDRRVLHALARIKGAAAPVNAGLKDVPAVDRRIARAIAASAEEVVSGIWDEQFPVDVFQTGSGTSTNMNMNEVLSRLASERLGEPGAVHPNDHVNASQSSNDVFPSAIRIATALALRGELAPAAEQLAVSLRRQARRQRRVVKSGRTHLMDATPVTLGQELAGYATQVEHAAEGVEACVARVCELPLGGTAVGTGINAPKTFARRTIAAIATDTGLPLVEAGDHFAVQGAQDALVACSGALRTMAVALTKVANDLRWMGSGPRAGLGEIRLPALQPGSSIMPGKVNPVIPEVVAQVAVQVVGNDAAVAMAGSQGAFELNVYLPVMARNLLESIELLATASTSLAERCVDGLEADEEQCRRHAEASASVVTSLAPYLGYERAAEMVKVALAEDRPVREIVEASGALASQDVDAAFDLLRLTKGGVV